MPAAKTKPASTRNAATLTFPSDREMVITRVFNAPRKLVFEASTTPEHVRQWWGPRGTSLAVCEIDLRPGGKWRYVIRGADGQEFGFSGVYREIVAPERMVYTEEFEAMPGTGYVVTATLEERDGKTTLTAHLLYQAKEHRDGHLQSGMEGGMQETHERLDELLEQMA